MQNKGVIVFLTVLITGLCLYYLSFTFVSNNVQKKADAYATDASGKVDFVKRRMYLSGDSRFIISLELILPIRK
jgi:SecD/SecF fusion protein